MTVYAKVKGGALVFEPIPDASAPNGSIYMDSSAGNVLTSKSTGGVSAPIGATSSADIMIKSKRNTTGSPIAAYKRVALKLDGTICLSDSDDPVAMRDIGLALDTINHNSYGRVLLNGANASGVLTGLGYVTGDNVYLSKTPGALTNDVSSFNPDTDTIMRVGIADCASGAASGTATDLIMTVEVYSSPGGA